MALLEINSILNKSCFTNMWSMQKAGEGASGLHPPSAQSSLSSHTRNCCCKVPLLGRHRGKSRQCPKPKGQKCLPFCRCRGAPPDPTPCISYVPELLRPKAKQQETLSPGVLGKLRHKNLCFSIRNEVTEQENIKYPRIRSSLH